MKGGEKEQSSERKRNRMIDMERQRELGKKKAQTDRHADTQRMGRIRKADL